MTHSSAKTQARAMVRALTEDHMVRRLRLQDAATIRQHVSKGKFPASWFTIMREDCASMGIECPEYLFNFKRPPITNSAEGSSPDCLGSSHVNDVREGQGGTA